MKVSTAFVVASLLGSVASAPRIRSRFITRRAQSVDITNPANAVDVFVGTTKGGHVFPGPTIPHGFVKVGMDTDSPGAQAGYDADPTYNAVGFSQLHDDGTGGGFSLSNFKIWPIPDCTDSTTCPTSISARKRLRKVLPDGSPDDIASPGYFASNLTSNVRVELTSTKKTALHRYTFSANAIQPRILIDVVNDGQLSGTNLVVNTNPTSGRVTVSGNYAASFGPDRYNLYGCVDFKGDGYDLGSPIQSDVLAGNIGALVTLKANSGAASGIFVRVGVSFISISQACSNAESEIPGFDFNGVRQASWNQWNELLGRIKVDPTGVDPQTLILFYTSLYRTHIVPADYTGENPNWNSTEPYFDSLYCNWDTYRNLYPLMSLHDPITFANIVRGMIDIQRHEGWLPECRGANTKQWVQGGSNGDPILGEFFVKFQAQAQSLGVNAADLYTALVADAEIQPADWDLAGRSANIWKSLNYIPQDQYQSGGSNTRVVSRTLEYAFDDFAISQVAKLLGNTADAAKYLKRAGNYINVWNPDTVASDNPNVKGMMQPRFANGTFNYTDPSHCSVNDHSGDNCYLSNSNTDGFYESSPLVYSQYVPQDTAKLVELQGGNANFISRLDYLFNRGYYDVTDEPSMQIPFMYHYANRPGLSTQRTRQVLAQSYNISVNGLPGNDDSGAMGAYAVFFLAGLYPVPATRQYLLSSPFFPQISFYNPLFNTTTTIKANGFAGNPANGVGGSVFVKSVTIDGQPWKSNCYLEWDAFVKGSTIVLELTNDITVTCGNDPAALPPSISTGGFN